MKKIIVCCLIALFSKNTNAQQNLTPEKMWSLGTPEDLNYYLENY